jgi:putative FmdB family regulatory protein
MPIFEYHCEKCDQTFECLVIGSSKPACTACNSKKVRKLMSACGFVSKGGGGQTVRQAAGSSSCGGCHASSCGGCKH